MEGQCQALGIRAVRSQRCWAQRPGLETGRAVRRRERERRWPRLSAPQHRQSFRGRAFLPHSCLTVPRIRLLHPVHAPGPRLLSVLWGVQSERPWAGQAGIEAPLSLLLVPPTPAPLRGQSPCPGLGLALPEPRGGVFSGLPSPPPSGPLGLSPPGLSLLRLPGSPGPRPQTLLGTSPNRKPVRLQPWLT